MMFIDGKPIPYNSVIKYFDLDDELKSITCQELIDRGYMIWRTLMSKVSMNLKHEDYIIEWMYLNQAWFKHEQEEAMK